ncbi:MAG: hypothetical protein MJK10_06690 [Pseudomonadales bacterium]|nr:hypothetical protein [Pseudomonadales bacterium]NRA14015.1 hypothetical protein [Oceanospirillaceae bacterium]
MQSYQIKTWLLFCCLSSLLGCANNYPLLQQQMATDATLDRSGSQRISVNTLLQNAATGTIAKVSQKTVAVPLKLQFQGTNIELSNVQQQRLRLYANALSAPVLRVHCGAVNNSAALQGAAIALRRCQKVQQFLSSIEQQSQAVVQADAPLQIITIAAANRQSGL